MSENMNLYDFFIQVSPKSTTSSIIFQDERSKQTISYITLKKYIDNICDIICSISASRELICCVTGTSIILPAVILGILKSSSAFSLLDVSSALSSFQNVKKYVPSRVIFAEEKYFEKLKLDLCSCWKILSNGLLTDMSMHVFYVLDAPCSDERCLNKLFDSNLILKCHSSLAYVIQTSGTTGDPKVVQVPHHCILPNIIHLGSLYNIKQEDVILLCSPLTFDPSIVELLLALVFGATLVIIPDYIRCVPNKLSRAIVESNITILQVTPSLMQRFDNHFVKTTLLGEFSPLRILSFGGEKCPSKHKLQNWVTPGNKTELYNLYGLTELSCWATFEKINLHDSTTTTEIPLGQPLQDTVIEVRNDCGEKLCDGEGQLFIGGSKRWCVVNDESWPTDSCSILRPTCDWVKVMHDQIWFEGRKDDMIKHNGRKLSLQAVNSLIEVMSEIDSHAVHFDHTSAKLCLYIVLNSQFSDFYETAKYNLLKHLRQNVTNLPVVQVVQVPFIPVTKHGKIDFKKLFKSAESQFKRKLQDSKHEVSESDMVTFMSSLWQDYTEMSHITDADNFIHNGGNSIKAVQLASEIEWKFGVTIPLLVDTLLNGSFRDVCSTIQLYVCSIKKDVKEHTENKSSCIKEDITQDSTASPFNNVGNYSWPLKEYLCYAMSSRRGIQLFGTECDKSKEIIFCQNKKLKKCDKLYFSLQFKVDLGKCIDASPCITHFMQNDCILVFIGSHSGQFCAINVKTGVVKWEMKLPDRIESSACLSSCGNYVLVGCYDHHLYCFDIEQGICQWKIKTDAEIKSSPVVSIDNKAFVGSHDKHLYAIKIEGGSILWKKRISDGSIFSSPALSEVNKYVCTSTLDGVIAVLDQDSGVILWSYKYNKPLFSSPLFHKTSIFIGCTDGFLLQFDLTGALVMKYPVNGSIFSSPTLSLPNASGNQYDIIFGSHDCHLYCLSHDGQLRWKSLCESPVYSTAFVFESRGKCLVAAASTKGTIFIFDGGTGNVLCKWKSPGEIFSSPVVLQDYLLIGCRDNNLYCFRF